MKTGLIRKTVDVTGVVQGVGFRPTVYRLAREAGLGGWVQNRSGAVRLAIEGPVDTVEAFLRDLPSRLPPNARMTSTAVVAVEPIDALSAGGFAIIESSEADETNIVIPADLAMCPECRRDILEPGNRRYGYPFTTCTRCGPRYTVVQAMPYDRRWTTLSVFPLCPACRREYSNPDDRRFHAESMACPVCGPRLAMETADGLRLDGDPLRRARRELANGAIVAVRGLGGYLLAADAFNRDTLRRLRDRKQRPHKPLAVMAPDLDTVRRFAEVTDETAALMKSPVSPIVILDLRTDSADTGRLPRELIAPDTATLGMMLPTSPLHLLLAEPLAGDPGPRFELLVMTSGNRRGEPICLGNDEARERLREVADFLLVHDREINLRNDDSVFALQGGRPQVWRRARGLAPESVRLVEPLRRNVLAMGADMKNAVSLGFGRTVVLSPHVGDLDTPEAIDGLEQVVRSLPEFLKRRPDAVAVDLHPDMQSTRLGRRIAAEAGLPVTTVQHHHAHAVACLAEHGLTEGLAVVMDGTGLGPDGTVWGAELLEVNRGGYVRRATFAAVPMPGGDAAVRRPARQLVARWNDAGVSVEDDWLGALGVSLEEVVTWEQQCRRRVNAPMTHAAGRVFDSFSALLGASPARLTYEGQPAIRLEALARRWVGSDVPDLPFEAGERDGLLVVDWRPAFVRLADRGAVTGREAAWAMAVHRSVAAAVLRMVDYGLEHVRSGHVALSGGVFMNRILNDLLAPRLEGMGLNVLVHRNTPPGDGCIALGQAVVAGMKTENG